MTIRKWQDPRDLKRPWRVTVRSGARVDVHRFCEESQADAFATRCRGVVALAMRA